MALNKQHYIDLGNADALARKPRPLAEPKSWQERAYMEGFDSAVFTFERVDAAQAAGVLPSQEEADHYAKQEVIPAPVLEHCYRLNAMAHKETNVGRAVRLRAKVATLEAKYNRKYVNDYGRHV